MATRLSSRLLILPPAATTTPLRPRKPARTLSASYRRRRTRLSVAAQAAPSGGAVAPAAAGEGEKKDAGLPPAEAQRLVEFLKDDLPHLFDDVGIDRSAYDDRVRFRDPITRYDDIDGYLANINLLKAIFRPDFYLHDAKQTGPYEITTRWTMVMKFSLLPWKPELIFTGLSIMGVNPQNLKFCSHVDIWDSIQNNEYFSFEGLVEVFKQLRYYKTPDIETPSYLVLKKTANYEVRRYPQFSVVQAKAEKLTGSSGFNNVTGYIFGKNASSEKIPMTTPVFTQASNDKLSDVSIQIPLPMNKDLNRFGVACVVPTTDNMDICSYMTKIVYFPVICLDVFLLSIIVLFNQFTSSKYRSSYLAKGRRRHCCSEKIQWATRRGNCGQEREGATL
uniref:Uncharacterized protein n=1 Tax=Avena sativa TaxID=4498 RepID=A0ACD5WTI6_AVESA